MIFKSKSYREGDTAEDLFIKLRGDNFIRRANANENMNQHWDVLDKVFGRVDVKAPKRKNRSGPIDYAIWWELKTVNRPTPKPGWGVPNGIDRYIALQCEKAFYLVDPKDVIDIIQERCTEKGRGEWLLHSRPGRGDLMTMLPFDFIQEYSFAVMDIPDGL